jgi:hypothetical protein
MQSWDDTAIACDRLVRRDEYKRPDEGFSQTRDCSEKEPQGINQGELQNTRKVIFSTNIAETSLTIPGIRIVIDSGKIKMR